MNEHQRLFLVQARSSFDVFQLLRKTASLPACHALHYLQMSTELLAKAHARKLGAKDLTHRAFVPFLRSLATNRKAQTLLGLERLNEQWEQLIRKAVRLAESIEKLAPTLAHDGPNPEYPWPRADPRTAPAEYDFELWRDLTASDSGRKFLAFVEKIFAVADRFL